MSRAMLFRRLLAAAVNGCRTDGEERDTGYMRLGLTRLEDRVVLDAAGVVADINPGTDGSSPTELTQFNGSVYFAANGTNAAGQDVGRELYRLDADGSVQLVADINSGTAGSDPSGFTIFDTDKLVFAATGPNGRELYRIDTSGTVSLVADINPGTPSSDPVMLTEFNDKLYFTATTAAKGREIYVLNRGGNVSLIADINPGPGSSDPGELFESSGNLFFTATGPGGRTLYRQSPSGTSDPVAIDLGTGVTDPHDFMPFNGKLYFNALDVNDGRELFVLEITKNNVTTVSKVANIDDTSASSSPGDFFVFGDKLYFSATAQNGRELFQLDTAQNIVQVDVNPGSDGSSPSSFTTFNGELYFAATVGGQRGLFRLDTSGATPSAVSVPLPAGVTSPQDVDFRELLGELYFAADGPFGNELYRLDATGNVSLVVDVNLGSGSSNPAELTLFTGQIYFVATEPSVGRELFELLPAPSTIQIIDNRLVFTDENGEEDNRLVISSDGANLHIRDENGFTIFVLASISGATGSGTNEVAIPFVSLVGVNVLEINTRGGDDSVTFDLSSSADTILGQFAASTYDGGTNSPTPGDRLRFVGDTLLDSLYTPDASVTGSGVVVVSSSLQTTSFEFLNIEPVDFTGMDEARLATPATAVGADVLIVSEGFDSLDGQYEALVVSGTVDGVTIETAYFFANNTVVIDTAGGVDGPDLVTVDGAANGHANTNLVIDTGATAGGPDGVFINGAVQLAGDLSIDTTRLEVAAAVVLGGAATLAARDDVEFSSSGSISAAGPDAVAITADSDHSGGGAITMADGSSIDAGSGAIALVADGNIAIGGLKTTNATSSAVEITTTSGGLIDGGDADIDIMANSPGAVTTIAAQSGVGSGNGLETQIDTAVLTNTTSGNVELDEVDDLVVNEIDQQAPSGAVNIDSGGTITVANGQAGIMAVNGQVDLRATVDIAVNAQITTVGGAVNVLADQDVTFDAASGVNSSSGNVTVAAASGAITMADGSSINAGSGDILLSADGDVTLSRLVTSAATLTAVSISSTSGGVIDGGDTGGEDIEANSAGAVTTISAHSGVGDAGAIDTRIDKLALSNSASGDIDLTETDDLRIDQIEQLAPGNTVNVDAGGSITVTDAGAGVSAENGQVELDAGVDITVDNQIETLAGPVNVLADRHVTFDATSGITSSTGNVTVEGGSGAITMADGALIDAGNGEIALAADGDITLGGLKTTNNTSTAVQITTTSGGVVDGGDTNLEIEANSPGAVTTISAHSGVGSSNALEMQIDTLVLTNTASGNVGLNEADDLVINLIQQQATSGAVQVDSGGTITIADGLAGITAVDAQVDLHAAADIVINAQIMTVGGAVSVLADQNVTFDADSGIKSSTGNVTVEATSGAITMADGALIDAGSGQVALTADGDITLGRLVTNNATGAAIQITTSGAVLDGGDTGGADIVAPSVGAVVTIDADSGVGTAADSVDTDVRNLVVHTANADQFLSELNGLDSLLLDAGAGDVTLAAGGAINDGDADVDVRASSLTISGASIGTAAAPLQTEIAVLTAKATSGDMHFVESDDLTVLSAAAPAGNVEIANLLDNMTVVEIQAAGAVTLTAQTGSILDDGDNATRIAAERLVLQAAGSAGIVGATTQIDAQVEQLTASTGQGIALSDYTGNLLVESVSASAASAVAQITVLAGDLLLQSVALSGAGSLVTLQSSAGAVLDANGAALNVGSASLEITAAGGVGVGVGDALETAVMQLEADGGSGGVFVTNSGNLQIGGIAPSLLGLTGVMANGAAIGITTAGSLFTVETVETTGGGSVTLAATDDITAGAPITTAVGGITLAAGRHLALMSAADLSTSEGMILLVADSDGVGGGTIQSAADVAPGTGTVIFSLTNADGQFSGVISGEGNVVKQGPGGLTFTSTSLNTYVGTTDVLAGTLRVDGAIGAGEPAGLVTIAGGVVLTGGGDVNAPVFSASPASLITSAGNLTLGDGSTAGFNFAGTLLVNAGQVVTLRDADLAGLGVLTSLAPSGRLVAANGVEVAAGEKLAGFGAVSGNIMVLAGGQVSPGASPGVVTTDLGDLQLFAGALFVVEVNGASPGAQYDQLNVNGTVSFNGAVLGLSGGLFRPPDGTVFTLIANDGVDPISGIFFDAGGNPLGEGATLRFGGIEATISYSGGAGGNDVTLTVTDAINFRTQLLSDASGAGTFFAANALGGGGAAVEQPKLTAPPLLAPSTAPVSSQAFEVVVKETEFRTTERLRVYFRIVNDATGEEEKEEFALDPSVLRDLLGIFKRFKFRDHHYRIYLQEPGKSERLILDVYILDGRVVPANFRETEGQNTQPAKPDANQAAPSDSTPAESPASAPQAPAGETPPDEATGQSPAGAQQGHPETTTADRSPAQTTDPPGTQGVEFQIPASPPTNDGAMHTAPSHTSAARWITAAAASGAVLSTTATASNWREQVRELLAGKEMPLGKTARLLRRARRD